MALVTDNMDVFNEITIPHHRLGGYFSVIVNSCDHGLLKKDEGGRLFDIALARLGAEDYTQALLIDDSANVARSSRQGGTVHTYTDYEEFERWMSDNLQGWV